MLELNDKNLKMKNIYELTLMFMDSINEKNLKLIEGIEPCIINLNFNKILIKYSVLSR